MTQFKKAVIQRAMGAQMSHHLGYLPGQDKPAGMTHHRNGRSAKTVLTDTGAIDIDVPRDRQGSFEPLIVGKHERRFTGFDDKIIAKGSRCGPYLSRPLEPMYPVVFFDALRVKVREDNVVRSKAVYLALGMLPDGTRDILGIWIENTKGGQVQLLKSLS